MSHRVYTTLGLVLSSSSQGEANKTFSIFTEDFGLIKATAQGIRHNKSKLRYGLQELSWGRISVVRGQEIWRLTNVEPIWSIWSEFRANKPTLMLFARSASLLKRLLHGEEKNVQLFEHLKFAAEFALNNKIPERLLQNLEYILVLRILHSLGYVGESPDFEVFIRSPFITLDLITQIETVRGKILGEINNSIRETQL